MQLLVHQPQANCAGTGSWRVALSSRPCRWLSPLPLTAAAGFAPQKFNRWLDEELSQGPQNSLLVYPEGTRRCSCCVMACGITSVVAAWLFARQPLPLLVHTACSVGVK